MALPGSGAISFSDIATELGRSGTSVNFSQTDVLTLAGKSAGQSVTLPNDFWGKSIAPVGFVVLDPAYSINDTNIGSEAIGEIEFLPNGNLRFFTTTNDAFVDFSGWWSEKPSDGIGSSFEIRATLTSGSVSSGSAATGTWLSLGTNRIWRRRVFNNTATTILTIDIRNLSGVIQDTTTLTITVDSDIFNL